MHFWLFWALMPRGSEGLPKGLEGLPKGLEGLSEGSKGLPEGPKGLVEGPEGLLVGPEGLPGGQGGHTDRQTDVQMDSWTEFISCWGPCAKSRHFPQHV